jgi:hypothetical protein
MRRRLSSDGSAASRTIFALTLVLGLIVLRTWNISETFWLLGDQIRDWKIALRPWRDLPLGGVPSSIGGTTLGPAFVWTLWGIRHLIGPWTDNLPHAGGIGLSIIQSAADGILLLAIWKRFASLPLALAVTLFIATAPFDMSLSATIWNPPLAVALVKATIAIVLLGDRGASVASAAAATATAVLAVQCHSSAVFFAAPVIAAFPAREALARRPTRALQYAVASAAVILALQTPLLMEAARGTGRKASPAAVVASVTYTFANPEALRSVASYQAFTSASEYILLQPWRAAWFGTFLAACAAVTAYRGRRDIVLSSVTFVPLVATVAGFSLWQRPFQHYWYLTLMPSVGITIGLALTAWRPAAPFAAGALLLVVLAAQPSRFLHAMTLNRLPEYGALARGSRDVRQRLPEVRRLDVEFTVPRATDTSFIYVGVLGGRVTPTATFAATIERTGNVRFTEVD